MKKSVLALIVLGFSGAVLAQAPAFEEADANGDGMISADEAAAVEGLDLASADTNQDGSLDRDEYSAATGQ